VNAPLRSDPATPLRTSPLHSALEKLSPRWSTINQMQVVASIGTPASEREKLQTIALADLSHLKRCGLKGPGAEAWLKSIGIEPPPGINQWAPLGPCSLIARLASSEFLLEDNVGQDYADRVRTQLGRGVPGVTPVLRQDAEIVLAGPRINELLLQTCSFSFAALDLVSRPIVMTSMIGVSVLLIPITRHGAPFYQIWCDGTYAVYLWEHLLEIAVELGGGAVGLSALFPETMGNNT
jgi:sarcosine oxidase, subunit gamma